MALIFCFLCGNERRGICFGWGLVLTVAVFITQFPFMLSRLAYGPRTTVSMVGGRVRMSCATYGSIDNSSVDWEFAPAETNNISYIYTAGQVPANLSSRYKIDTDNRTRYDIVIDSVDSSHAGTYICTPLSHEGFVEPVILSGSAQLIVLESDPVCSTNESASTGDRLEGVVLNFQCAVNYTGNWIPVMDWNSTGAVRIFYPEITILGSTKLTSIRNVQLGLDYSDVDGFAISCLTSFNSESYKYVRGPRQGEIVATNKPNYQYMWTFKRGAPSTSTAFSAAATSTAFTAANVIVEIALGFAVIFSVKARN